MGLEDVQLPDNFDSTPADSGTEIAPSDGAQGGDEQVSRQAATPEATENKYLDLDKLERFRFGGRDYTPKELKGAILRHEDYTKKTTELSEARKYSENFTQDLQTVIDNPARFADFRAVYPKAYVEAAQKILDRVRGQGQPKDQANPGEQSADPRVNREVSSLKEQFAEIQKRLEAQEVEKTQAWLDNQYSTLSKKYPHADSEVVTARAEAANAQGVEITDKVLDKLFKAHHAEVTARWEKVYKEKVNEQAKAGARARDIGTGGGTPGNAPRKLRTLKEAEAAMLADIAATSKRR